MLFSELTTDTPRTGDAQATHESFPGTQLCKFSAYLVNQCGLKRSFSLYTVTQWISRQLIVTLLHWTRNMWCNVVRVGVIETIRNMCRHFCTARNNITLPTFPITWNNLHNLSVIYYVPVRMTRSIRYSKTLIPKNTPLYPFSEVHCMGRKELIR